jgi:tRNA (adenine57-N1/adenine58-N1)-methyltransferase
MKPFSEGEDVVIRDAKGREYLVTLKEGDHFSTHRGTLSHGEIIGRADGTLIKAPSGEEYIVFRPTFNQFVMNLKRTAQIIYPKDIGPILLWADVHPGALVVEGGAGWGALTIALLRALGERGKLVTYEIRKDFAAAAERNIRRFLGKAGNFEIKLRDLYEGIEERNVDRVILDLPEPWRAVEHVRTALRSGGIFLSYLPTIIQVKELCETVRSDGGFSEPEIFEVIHRPWNVKGMSVRPVSWMFSHSAFITVARRIERCDVEPS